MTIRQDDSQPSTTLFRDPLTGAYSRALFDVRLHEEIERARRHGDSCILCLFDIDHFKSINDAYGHQRGDQILQDLVARVQQNIRDYDLLFRYGGDEFILLLPQTSKEQVLAICERLFASISVTPFNGDPLLTVAISMGVASFPSDASDGKGLLEVADRRSYVAKRQGRGQFVIEDVEARPSLYFDPQGRLIEREGPQEALQTFLHQLDTAQRGVFTVRGAPGSGLTRFLEEVAQAAKMRNYAVIRLQANRALQSRPYGVLAAARWTPPLPFTSGIESFERAIREGLQLQNKSALLIAVDDWPSLDRATRTLLQQFLIACTLPRLALACTTLPLPDKPLFPVPDAVTVEVALAPLTGAGLRLWLRGLLLSEPPVEFSNWLYSQTAGLPGRVQYLLTELNLQGLLQRAEAGTWQLSRDFSSCQVEFETEAPPTPPNNLPASLTEFVGREKECWELDQLLNTRRLVTLVGPGGIGKTRLALEMAIIRQNLHPDGVWFIPLEGLRDPSLVLPTITQTLGILEDGGQNFLDSLTAYLKIRKVLLILDNFEQVIEAATSLTRVLNAAPQTQILVTSRERLRVSGEQVFTVPSLGLPPLDNLPSLSELESFEAINLFVNRAREARYDFSLTNANAQAIAEICVQLDGIPLALELAAARIAQVSPKELVAQLKHRLTVLTDGPRNLTARQRTLRGALEWGYSLLDPAEQMLFARLAVFAGGCTLRGAEAICQEDMQFLNGHAMPSEIERLSVYSGLSSLVNKSLLQMKDSKEGESRYSMLETVREYALEQLDLSRETQEMRQRHADYFLRLVEQIEPDLTGPNQQQWLALLEQDHNNIRSLLDYLLGHSEVLLALRFVSTFWKFWQFRGYFTEGRRWMERVFTQVDTWVTSERYRQATDSEQREIQQAWAKALWGAGWLANDQADFSTVRHCFDQSLAIARTLGDQRAAGLALQGVGAAAVVNADMVQARQCFAEAREIFRQLGEKEEFAFANDHLARVMRLQGDLAGAEASHRQSFILFEQLGHIWAMTNTFTHLIEVWLAQGDLARVKETVAPRLASRREQADTRNYFFTMELFFLGEAKLYSGDLDGAEAAMQESMVISLEQGYSRRIAQLEDSLARIALRRGDHIEARRRFMVSLNRQVGVENWLLLHFVEGVAALACANQDDSIGLRLCSAVAAHREASHTPIDPIYSDSHQQTLQTLREHLGAGFEEAWKQGQILTLEQTLELARGYLIRD